MIRDLLVKHKIMFYDKKDNYLVRCLNPEHEDRNPSMWIHKETGRFICFSCGIKGGYRSLRKLLGEEVLDEPSDALQVKTSILISQLMNLYKYQEPIEVPKPTHYARVINEYRGISPEVLRQFNVFISNTEEFQGRIWVPISDRGKTIGFIGRSTVEGLNPKYMFLPRHINLKNVIFGIDSVPHQTVILTEGIFDMLKLRTFGINEACCIFGTHFGPERVATLLANDINVVITMLDGDAAGKRGAEKAKAIINRLAPHILVETVYLAPNTDPGDLTKEQAFEVLAESKVYRMKS